MIMIDVNDFIDEDLNDDDDDDDDDFHDDNNNYVVCINKFHLNIRILFFLSC